MLVEWMCNSSNEIDIATVVVVVVQLKEKLQIKSANVDDIRGAIGGTNSCWII